MSTESYLTLEQCAEVLGYEPCTVRTYIRYNPDLVPKVTRQDGRSRFSLLDVTRFLQEREAVLDYGLTKSEAAKYLGMTPIVFQNLITLTGYKPRSHQLGHKYYYFMEDLHEWATLIGMTRNGWARPAKWNIKEGH